ncbi:MAG: hypothetical protein IE928_10205, partial [Gammaproteobacteria bacterium]|nr:hypothetical protein [Gammaproteobacteria bacterium]
MAYQNLKQMRDAFLSEAQTKLLAKDFSTASDNELIICGAMVRAFDSVNNFDPITIETLSFIEQVSDFNGYLDDPSNLLDF